MLKFNKIPIFLIVCVLIISVAFGIWLLVDGVGQEEKAGLELDELYKVNIYGTQGEGFVDLQINESYLQRICDESGIDLTAEDVKATVSKENNLYNGDKITVSFVIGKALKDKGVNIISDTITYSVKGLKEGTDFDVFSDLNVYIEDEEVVIDNSRCSNFVKDNVDFFIKNQLETYKEGDTVIVGAHVDMNAATDNGYNIEKTETEFFISEISEVSEEEKTND